MFPPEHFPQERIRNFSIIAHIDHGKSTLADRLIEASGRRKVKQAQLLDSLQVERERGITVKANSASIVCRHQGSNYLLNLVDTPGHVDFSYEVSRSLAACQGALLLVDGAQGIQAQTVANFYLAFELDLEIIPVINKIDLPAADPARVSAEMESAFDLDASTALHTSAKAGVGIRGVLEAVIERIPAPQGDAAAPFRLLLFDAVHDEFRGVICMVLVRDGVVRKGDRVTVTSSGDSHDVHELGMMTPEMQPTSELRTGQVGYVITGLKSTHSVRVGDTWYKAGATGVEALPGFQDAKAMMYAGLYPQGPEGFEGLSQAMSRLLLTDASVAVKKETSAALGPGFRCGFLGMLHMDVFMQRLEQEHGEEVLMTNPMVPYRLTMASGEVRDLDTVLDFPRDGSTIVCTQEPTVNCTILLPAHCTGTVLRLCNERRGELQEQTFLTSERCLIRYQLPAAELAGRFYSELKAATSGYATFDYEAGPYREADLVRLDFLVHGELVDALARVVHRSEAQAVGRRMCIRLKDTMARQSFEVAIQAAIGGRVVARETVRATRKDVLAKCYGGDVSRKRKLLDKQKEGKRRMRQIGSVTLDPESFHTLMAPL